MTAPDAECCYAMSIAYGLKGWNYYIFAGGPNPPKSCNSCDPYDAQAAVGADGSVREIHSAQRRTHALVRKYDWLAAADRVADCHLGMVWEYGRSWGNGFGANRSADLPYTQLDAWDLAWKGMLMSAACENLQVSLLDLSKDSCLSRTDLPMMVPSALAMPADVQRRLVKFVQAGGKLLIAPVLPRLDEDFNPCAELADFLGIGPQQRYVYPSPILDAFDVKNFLCSGDLFLPQAEPRLLLADGGDGNTVRPPVRLAATTPRRRRRHHARPALEDHAAEPREDARPGDLPGWASSRASNAPARTSGPPCAATASGRCCSS